MSKFLCLIVFKCRSLNFLNNTHNNKDEKKNVALLKDIKLNSIDLVRPLMSEVLIFDDKLIKF